MDELGEHTDLCGSDRWSVIPYVHGEGVLYCYVFAQAWVTVTLCVSNPHDYVNHMFKRP
jgi:hypothetical protein